MEHAAVGNSVAEQSAAEQADQEPAGQKWAAPERVIFENLGGIVEESS